MQALILAGGAGTRLRSVLPDLNKPMAPVAGKPFLEYLLMQLKRYGINEVTLCVGYKADLIRSYFSTGERWGIQISYSYEADFCGTAGALKLAENLIHGKDFLVMNGDSLLDIELPALISYHFDMQAKATLALAYVNDTRRYGAVDMDKSGRIVQFNEKREGNGEGLINGGIYVFTREVLGCIPEGQPVSLEKEILPMFTGKDLYGLASRGYFVDIGVPADYEGLCSNPAHLQAAVDQWRYASCLFAPRPR
jgi:NDP-sugar pyrophosphorylase family protein